MYSTLTNAEVAAVQIEKHGRDRYPTVQEQFIKLVEEIGELGKEINKSNIEKISKEAADAALALYNLASKLGFNLDKTMRKVVERDDRKFA